MRDGRWPLLPVGQTGEVQGGRQRSPHKQEGRIVPYLRVANVFDGYIDFSKLNEMAFTEQEINTYRLMTDDILLNEGQSLELVGRAARYRDGPNDCCFQNTLIRYRAGASVDPIFAEQLFRHCQHTGIFSHIAVRTNSIAHLGVSRFAELPLPFPPLLVQRKIAEILRNWDEAIEKLDQLINLHRTSYLGLRERLINWTSMPRSSLRSLVRPEVRQVSKPGESYTAISIRSHGKGTFTRLVADPATVDMEELYVARAGDLIVNITFAWEGAIALVPPEHDGYLVSHRFPTFVPRQGIVCPRYLRHAVRMPRFTYLLGLASPGGAGRNRVLNKSDFLDLEIPAPDFRRQKLLGEMLDTAEHTISATEKYRDTIITQKRGLMQKLLTGEWRVPAGG